ncbi:MAG: sugar phosphate nucleotidyltransferase [Planctomycetia bacterium]|nr:sugar phosphate nucleotidyltransferase [Planctomycetia bacterium]
MSIDLAVVPVAGLGTRLLPLTKSQPKEMLAVGRKPVAQYVTEELANSGIRRLLFITGPGKASIENHFDIDGELIAYLRRTGREEELAELDFVHQEEMLYFYTRQRRQLGLGHAVLCAEPLVGDQAFVVALGDSMIGRHAQSDIVKRMIAAFERDKRPEEERMVVAFEEVPREEVCRYGIAIPESSGQEFRLRGLIEKPSVEEAPSNLAVAARYVFSPGIFRYLEATKPGRGGEIQLTDAMDAMIKAGATAIGIKLSAEEKRFDIGNFESYFESFLEFALADERHGTALRKRAREILKEFGE